MANDNARILDSIKTSVRQKTTGIPFFLMPVRIETRFMERTFTTASMNTTAVQDALLSLVAIDRELQTSTPAPGINHPKTVDALAAACSITLNDIPAVTSQEKSQLLEIYKAIAQNIVPSKEGNKNTHPDSKTGQLRPMDLLEQTIQNIKVENPVKIDNPLIAEQEKLVAALENITKGPRYIPYYNFKNKKALYTYVRKLIDKTGRFFDAAPDKVVKMKRIEKTQVSQLKEQHGRMNDALAKLLNAVADIHEDKNWKAFSSDFTATAVSSLKQQSRNFEKESMAAIEQLPNDSMMKAHEVFFHGIKILMKVNKFNAEKSTGYDAVKKYKKYVGPLFQTLSKSIGSEIEESRPGQYQKLQELFALLDKAFALSRQKVATFKTQNKAQEFGIQTTLNFHDNISESIIQPLVQLQSFAMAAAAATTVVKKQLCVRIYPDDIFLHTHELLLTQTEVDTGKSFWMDYYRANGDVTQEKIAWKTLCVAAGANRASWIARQMDPRGIAANNVYVQTTIENRMQVVSDTIDACYRKMYTDYYAFPDSAASLDAMKQNGTLDNLILNLPPVAQLMRYAYNSLSGRTKIILQQNLDGMQQMIGSLQSRISTFTPAERTYFDVHITKLEQVRVNVVAVSNRWNAIANLDAYAFYRDVVPNLLTFPAVTTKTQQWTQAPTSKVLPPRFVVVTYSGTQVTHAVPGNIVTPNIQLGLDPGKFDNAELFKLDEQKNLVVDPGIKWMTDYETAEAAGMAVSIDLSDAEWEMGIDKVVVVGVTDADSVNGKNLLEELLTNHTYSQDGMAFLKPGTPTNNTTQRKSAFAPGDQDDQRFDIEIKQQRFNAGQADQALKADGSFFSNLLGINSEVVQRINNATQTETGPAFIMNRALWNGTLGHYMEEMLDNIFNYDNIRRAEEFFTQHVTARGIIPAVRIGAQPYGIITTTAFSKWTLLDQLSPLSRTDLGSAVKPWGVSDTALNNKLQNRFEYRLLGFLKMLHDIFTDIRNKRVMHAGNLQSGDPQQRFMKMLGLHANSLEYFYRYSINVAKGPISGNHSFEMNFKATDLFGPHKMFSTFKDQMKGGVYYPSFYFEDENQPGTSDPYKLTDIQYTRLKQQFEDSRLFMTRQVSSSYNTKGVLVDAAAATDTALLSIAPGLSTDYISWLLANTPATIFGNNEFVNAPKLPSQNLCFLLLRQSLLQATQTVALNMLQYSGLIREDFRKKVGNSKIYFNTSSQTPVLTKWNYLFNTIDKLADTGALCAPYKDTAFYKDLLRLKLVMGDYIQTNIGAHTGYWNAGHQPFIDKLNDVRNAVSRLKDIPVRKLEQLMAEHLDLCTYRLDAWMLGLVKKKMEERRVKNPSGIYLGAFGYVEGLKREKKTLFTDSTRLAPFQLQTGKPVYQDLLNQGAIHAPSLNHAIAAAVLRNAYKSNDGSSEETRNRLAVNLSSARIRMALQLAEGIRNGLSMGALLGFRLERGFHEAYQTAELDRLIQPLRKAYPLVQQVQVIAGDKGPAYASQVINGDDLLKDVYAAVQWQAVAMNTASSKTLGQLLKTPGYTNLPAKIKTIINTTIPNAPNSIFDAVIDEIDKIADAFDALGDLAISESVYQMVQGNHVRAAAMMDALAAGKSIPDPQIIDTPRTGTVVTQRMVLNLEPKTKGTQAPGWTGLQSVKYLAEPSLNYWMGTITGPASAYKYIIQAVNEDNSISQVDFSLETLGWQPIDLFTMQGDEHELSNILLTYYRLANPTQSGNVSIDIVSRKEDWSEQVNTVADLFLTIAHVRKLLANAKMLGANDLQVTDNSLSDDNPGAIRDMELQERVQGALAALQLFNEQLTGIPALAAILNGTTSLEETIITTPVYNQLMALMKAALSLGVPQAMAWKYDPAAPVETQYRSAVQYVLNLYGQTKERAANATTIFNTIDSKLPVKDKTDKLLEIAKVVLGNNFIIIPTFDMLDTAISTQLHLPADKKITRNGDNMMMDNWMLQLGKVRGKVHELCRFMQHTDLFDGPTTSVYPVQLPYSDQDYWLGVEYPSTFEPAGDKLSLILLQEKLLFTTGVKAGLLLDEWIEIIPGREETTGVSFHYNQPNAMPPQSVLLVHSPQLSNSWEWDDLVSAVIDTVELAKNRAVEPDDLETSMLSHVLPTIISEVVPPREKAGNKAFGGKPTMDFSENQPVTK
ncbi:hypothetical protein CLV59_104104 [Chitinophaga dinghuensis]|uniref:Uncharacterized protein n=1 Tax=Chitinophaga dinghuensis TaxID=1539050 RepID=A0A327VY30_9BACT|nr:hypothetical protein [Chitinophaga dinghuensis]RAJ81879.1 hypothetical protein CLV59_104104 [Chitinophaga dinghuensis]